MHIIRQTSSLLSHAAERVQTARVTSSISNFKDRIDRFEKEEYSPLHQKSEELKDKITKLEVEQKESMDDLKNGCALHKSFLEMTIERVEKLEQNLQMLESDFRTTFPEKEIASEKLSSNRVRDLISTFQAK